MVPIKQEDQNLQSAMISLLQNNEKYKHRRFFPSKKRTQTLLILTTVTLLSLTTLSDLLHSLHSKLRKLCAKTPYITTLQASSLKVISPYDGVDDARTPSHIQMCRAYLTRLDSPSSQTFEKVIITEDDDVCRNWDAPHYFLMRMFGSSLIGMVNENDDLEYRHNCQYTRVLDDDDDEYDFDMTTIQQILAQADLLFSSGGEGLPTITKEIVSNLCRGCLVHYDASKRPRPDSETYSRMTHECLLYPGIGTLDALSNAVGLTDEEAKKSMVPLNAMIPIITKLLRHAAFDWSHTIPSVPEKERESGVVIYIDESSTMMSASVFSKYIAQGATSISVLVSPLCARTPNNVCYKEASKLTTFLDSLFPLADVNINIVSSTATAYSRMIRAKHLLCHPGSVSCLFPALTKDENTYAIVGVSPLREGTYGWFDSLKAGERAEVVELEEADTMLMVDINYDDTKDESYRSNSEYNYMNVPTLGTNEYGTYFGHSGHVYSGHSVITGGGFGTRKDCTQIRGKMGSWDRNDYDLDWDYDALVQNGGNKDLHGSASLDLDYNPVGGRVAGNNNNGGGALAKGRFAWREDAFQDCKFDLLNLDGLCEVVHSMDLSRIFFVGDTLQSSMVSSFWNLLQNNQRDYISESIIQNDPNNVWSKTLNCLKHGRHFELAFTRNDRLSASSSYYPPSRINSGYVSNGVQCNPWVDYYNSNPRRTLVVASPGTNAYDGDHRYDAFQSDFDDFTKTVQSFKDRPNDLVLVRTAAPNLAAKCNNNNDLPISDNDMVQFNAYASRVVTEFEFKRRQQLELLQAQQQQQQQQQQEQQQAGSYPPIHMLDVAPMTFLHPHNRRTQQECTESQEEQGRQSDNLMDWWNHMLYNHLIDMAMNEKDGWTCESC